MTIEERDCARCEGTGCRVPDCRCCGGYGEAGGRMCLACNGSESCPTCDGAGLVLYEQRIHPSEFHYHEAMGYLHLAEADGDPDRADRHVAMAAVHAELAKVVAALPKKLTLPIAP